MNRWTIVIISGVLLVLLSAAYKKWSVNQALRKLMEIRKNGTETEFIQALDTDYIRFHFNDFTRNMMKLNFWIEKDREDEIADLIPHLKEMKMDEKEKITLLSRMFGYYISKENTEKAIVLKERLIRLLEGKKDDFSIGILHEVDQADAVYIRKDVSYIPVLEEMIRQIDNPEQKAVYLYRLAKLQDSNHEREKAAESLKQALESTGDPDQKKKLAYLIQNPDQINRT